ncbi:MAG: BCSC C-terminal domain-containing protein [Betaproteobacteria bacterium]|nr:BCSC C-terminal domain-containing protein [Betaproteobacteria bacterium]
MRKLIFLTVALSWAGSQNCHGEEILANKDYYSIQLASGSGKAMERVWTKVSAMPHARLEVRGGRQVLRIGFWPDAGTARSQLAALVSEFPGAYVRVAQYRPETIIRGWSPVAEIPSGEPTPSPRSFAPDLTVSPTGASQDPSATRMAPALQVARTQSEPEPLGKAPEPVPLPSPVLTPGRAARSGPASAGPTAVPPAAATAVPPAAATAEVPPAPQTPPQPPDTRPGPALPDETPLWAALKAQRFAEVLDRIRRLQASHPHWQPPAKLLNLAREGLDREKIERAISDRDDAALLELANQHPDWFGCEQPPWAWALARAHFNAGRKEAMQSILDRLIPGCGEEERLATLEQAAGWLPPGQWDELLAKELGTSHSPAGEGRLAKLRYDQLRNRFLASPPKESLGLLDALAPGIIKNRDADMALLAGWRLFNEDDTAHAAKWFGQALDWDPQRAEARHGLALCALREQRFDDALKLAQALPEQFAERKALMRDALVGQAGIAYQSGNYAGTLSLLDAAADAGELPRHARLMAAWARLNSNAPAIAADEFAALYRQQPDDESATGAIQSHVRSGRLADLETLAATEPLATRLREYKAQRAFSEKRFLAAKAQDAGRYLLDGSPLTPSLTGRGLSRDKSGSEGLSRLKARITDSLSVALPAGSGELRIGAERVKLDSGNLAANELIGRPPLVAAAYAFAPITGTEGWQPFLSWRSEPGQSTWQVEIGRSPEGGTVTPDWTGRLAWTSHESWGNYGGAVFREPVRESILSFAGLRDPYTGVAWGRVTRLGGEARFLSVQHAPWSYGASLRAEQLTGEGVADNTHLAFQAQGGYDLKLPGFDYSVLGVFAGAERYDRNLSRFTLGHGGYFSPGRYLHAGPSFDFLTEEKRGFILRGRMSLARMLKTESAAPFFPLAPDGRSYAEVKDRGREVNGELSAVFRVHDHLQAGFTLARGLSPQYADTVAGVFVRFLWDGRRSVLSGDLMGPGELR